METGAQPEALSDIDYGSDYDEIFENDVPELDRQTPAIDELDNHSSSKSSQRDGLRGWKRRAFSR